VAMPTRTKKQNKLRARSNDNIWFPLGSCSCSKSLAHSTRPRGKLQARGPHAASRLLSSGAKYVRRAQGAIPLEFFLNPSILCGGL
jgi:hypothetical protein